MERFNKRKPYRTRHPYERNSSEKKCTKFICQNKITKKKTCGILFNNGRCAVGDDVWRMSNRSDYCEYPFKMYKNTEKMEETYQMVFPEETVFYDDERRKTCNIIT